MTERVLELCDVIEPDQLATKITEKWIEWDMLRQVAKNNWQEIREYVYATDTTQTTNSQLPWKNKTTLPKLCQIRDNLLANYSATLFPRRKSIIWEGDNKDSNSVDKQKAITSYMSWAMSQASFKHEIDKCLLDYVDFGNCFGTVEWCDQRVETPNKNQSGYVGPVLRRISPLDLVMNPTAENFLNSPKIIRSLVSLGELKDMITRMSNDDSQEDMEKLWKYLKDLRYKAQEYQGDWQQRDALYTMDGFGTFRNYLMSEFAEVLTFYGDLYDPEHDVLLKNHVIIVVDRHKLICKKPNPSFFGYPPIFHSPWRKKQDNLWGMGPLDNLIGMQYRLDHIENMRADIVDLTTYPVQKVKGFVEDYTWRPGEKIFIGDEGDVELVQPESNVLNANFDLQRYEMTMEQMAGAPREAMGFRTPGEKTAYEVQSLENAAARVFQNKIKQFEEHFLEPLLNAMLELARRNLVGATTIKVMNEFDMATFQSLTVNDITGVGRIKPVAARHFSEQSQLVQNLTNLTGSGLWPVVQPHFSGIKLAKIVENIFELDEFGVFTPYIALAEQADAQKQANALEQQVAMETSTASGMGDDFDLSMLDAAPMPAPDAPVNEGF